MNDGIRHLLEYATKQRAIGREATSAELHSIAEVIDCEMRSLKDERDHWMELAHQWEAGASTRGFAERLEAASSERADVTLFGVDYTALPLDADGVPIRVGERVQLIGNDPSTVSHMSLAGDGWRVYVKYDGGLGTGSGEPSRIRHHHAPTVEDVLREFAQEMNENLGMYTGEAIDADEWREADERTIAEYAAKLRLAEGVDK